MGEKTCLWNFHMKVTRCAFYLFIYLICLFILSHLVMISRLRNCWVFLNIFLPWKVKFEVPWLYSEKVDNQYLQYCLMHTRIVFDPTLILGDLDQWKKFNYTIKIHEISQYKKQKCNFNHTHISSFFFKFRSVFDWVKHLTLLSKSQGLC